MYTDKNKKGNSTYKKKREKEKSFENDMKHFMNYEAEKM
jgi:hypothetical protein